MMPHRAPADRWLRIGLGLVIATMLYNIVEAVIALWAGSRAASIALIEFGLNSLIELSAGGILLWRLRLELRGVAAERVARADRRYTSLWEPRFSPWPCMCWAKPAGYCGARQPLTKALSASSWPVCR